MFQTFLLNFWIRKYTSAVEELCEYSDLVTRVPQLLKAYESPYLGYIHRTVMINKFVVSIFNLFDGKPEEHRVLQIVNEMNNIRIKMKFMYIVSCSWMLLVEMCDSEMYLQIAYSMHLNQLIFFNKPTKCTYSIHSNTLFNHSNMFRHFCAIFREFVHQLDVRNPWRWYSSAETCWVIKDYTIAYVYVHLFGLIKENKSCLRSFVCLPQERHVIVISDAVFLLCGHWLAASFGTDLCFCTRKSD